MSVKQSKTVHEALRLLDLFTFERPTPTLADLTREMKLPKSNVYRLLTTLESAGYVRRTPGNHTTFSLGLKLFELGSRAISHFDLRTEAKPYIQRVNELTRETTHLAILSDTEVIYLDSVDGANALRAYSHLGGRAPAHAVATGLAMLSLQPDSVINRVVERGLQRFTETTVTHPEVLRSRLADIRSRGVAVNMGGWNPQVLGIASPVIGKDGTSIAAIGISMLTIFGAPNRIQEVENHVIEVVSQFSQLLGGRRMA